MKAIIIDDEKRARTALNLLLEEYCPQISVIADCPNLPEGVKLIRRLQPDIVFLDIEMPGHSGLELLDFFDDDEINFSIIFTTAYNEYAIQAFKFSAVDYILKPILPEDLIKAIELVEKQRKKVESYKHLKENIYDNNWNKIAIPSGNLLLFINLDDTLYVKGDGSYSELFLKDNTKHIVSRNLKNFEETICINPHFVRVHKSYIVNLNYVNSFNKSDGGYLEISTGKSIPVSSDKTAMILSKIKLIKR